MNYDKEIADTVEAFVRNASSIIDYDSYIPDIAVEEAAAYFSGDKTAQEVAAIIQNRVQLYLDEWS